MSKIKVKTIATKKVGRQPRKTMTLEAYERLTKELVGLRKLRDVKETLDEAIADHLAISETKPAFQVLATRINESISAINTNLYGIAHRLVELSAPKELLTEDEDMTIKEQSVVGVFTANADSLDRISRTLERFRTHLDTIL